MFERLSLLCSLTLVVRNVVGDLLAVRQGNVSHDKCAAEFGQGVRMILVCRRCL
jgi:hypothetical protein